MVGAVPAGNDRWFIAQQTPPFLTLTDGKAVLAVGGRRGQGPGEFRRLDWIGSAPDGILTFSVLDQKMVHFNSQLDMRRQWQTDPALFSQAGLRPPSAIVGTTQAMPLARAIVSNRGPQPLGVHRRSARIVEVDSEGGPGRVWRTIQTDEVAATQGARPDLVVVNNRPPLQKRTITHVQASRLYILDTATGVLERSPGPGETDLRIRFAPQTSRPTEAQVEAAIRPGVENASAGARARVEQNLRRIVSPGPPPVLRTFTVDDAGRIWIWFDPVSLPRAASSAVLIDPGTRTATVYLTPAGFEPLGADRARLWGTVRDEFDIEYVVVLGVPAR